MPARFRVIASGLLLLVSSQLLAVGSRVPVQAFTEEDLQELQRGASLDELQTVLNRPPEIKSGTIVLRSNANVSEEQVSQVVGALQAQPRSPGLSERIEMLQAPIEMELRNTLAGADAFAELEPCSALATDWLMSRALQLEYAIAETSSLRFGAASLSQILNRGSGGKALTDDAVLSALEFNTAFRETQQQALDAQYDALAELVTAHLAVSCEDRDAAAVIAEQQPASLLSLAAALAQIPHADGVTENPNDMGTSASRPLDVVWHQPGEVLQADGSWQTQSQLAFDGSRATALWREDQYLPCEPYQGAVEHVDEVAQLKYRSHYLALQPEDFSAATVEQLGDKQQTLDEFVLAERRRFCLGLTNEDAFVPSLSRSLSERFGVPSTFTQSYSLNPVPTGTRLGLTSASFNQLALPNPDRAPDQYDYQANPLSFDYKVNPGLSLTYRYTELPTEGYTMPDPFENPLLMPACFTEDYYSAMPIAEARLLRIAVDPSLPFARNLASLTSFGFVRDPIRRQQLPQDLYLRSTPAGGNAWGEPLDEQWAIKRAGFDRSPNSAWNVPVAEGAEAPVIAVIDSGVDWHHADFDPQSFWRNNSEIPGNGVDDDNNGYIDDVIGWDFVERDAHPWDNVGHGTLVTGILAAAHNKQGVAGIVPEAKIMVLKVLNRFGNSRASYIAEAITYAVDQGAKLINISIGGAQRSDLEKQAIDYATSRGVLVVAASGNEGGQTDGYGPAAENGVLTVGASDWDDRIASFSNTGAAVDLVAPGLDVLSLRARGTDANLGAQGEAYEMGQNFVGDENRYFRASGTSFATPIVTGTAARMWLVQPNLTASQVRARLIDTAWEVGKPGLNTGSGAGLLDARTALTVGSEFSIRGKVDRVAFDGESETLQVFGTADANQFKRALLQIGAGESPGQWKYVGSKLKLPVRDGLLSNIPATEFDAAGVWTLLLTVEHASGTVRRYTKTVRLGEGN